MLGYIKSDSKKFKIFVANRVQLIRENSKSNSAANTSYGLSPSNQNKMMHWKKDGEFLLKNKESWAKQTVKNVPVRNSEEFDGEYPEVKPKVLVHFVKVGDDEMLLRRHSRVSS